MFREVLDLLPGGTRSTRRAALPVHAEAFDAGLFASSELLSDALFALFEAGLVKRPADDDDDAVIHAGFFVGSGNFYEKLRTLSAARRKLINMTRISYVNTLFGDEQRKRRQRQRAVFVNETMMVTLLGAAISDALDDGRVVSGVGGQFDFVSMAHSLGDARSILMCRARRMHKGVARSNIRWSYGHATVPRHHRDVYVSEYGVAATRGRSDSGVADAMIGISDSVFQPGLVAAAKRAGKLPSGYAVAADARDNLPQTLHDIFGRSDLEPLFPPYPLGTELTPVEQDLVESLEWLQHRTSRPRTNLATLAAAFVYGGTNDQRAALARMGLERPTSLKERVLRRVLHYALDRKSA